MYRKSAFRIAFALLTLPAAFCMVHRSPVVYAQTSKAAVGKTILEGMALDEGGEPLYRKNVTLVIRNQAGEEAVPAANFNPGLGGLYRAELKPGVYDLFVIVGAGVDGQLRPLRVNGVLVKGGKINKLDLTLHQGRNLEVIGASVETTLPAIIISQKLDDLQKQINDLKKK